ncbi:DNA photolyase [Paracoccaceae bacterium]|nr:DNA photolyase [Paracoccaceae bacterium]
MIKNATLLNKPTRASALEKLTDFIPKAGLSYRNKRNYDFGPSNHNYVSQLSPFIRRRILTETEILKAVLNKHGLSSAEKFVQEVFWRTYWKGWLEMRPSVWLDYQNDLSRLENQIMTQAGLRKSWGTACEGKTGIECFDSWAHELKETGYLHNHARMWFASIWIFTLNLPWQLGADFFLRHLLDGDPASNTLSWRWVAGIQTQGKTYLARRDNICKYTNNRFDPIGLSSSAVPLTGNPHPNLSILNLGNVPDSNLRTGLLIHDDDLDLSPVIKGLKIEGTVAVNNLERISPWSCAKSVHTFVNSLIEDVSTRYKDKIGSVNFTSKPNEIETWYQENRIEQIVVAYAATGPNALLIKTLIEQGLNVIQMTKDYDQSAWPHATHGFFRFKEKIPALINKLGLNS